MLLILDNINSLCSLIFLAEVSFFWRVCLWSKIASLDKADREGIPEQLNLTRMAIMNLLTKAFFGFPTI